MEQQLRGLAGKIIGIANQKGGVGKTTSAISIAAALGKKGYKTLLVDIDPQGNASSGTGINTDELTASIYELLIGSAGVGDVIQKTQFNNLYIIPANMNLIGAGIELQEIEDNEHRLKQIIEGIAPDYDYIILDPPPSLGILTLNVLIAAEWLLIPVQCEYYALEGLKILQAAIDRIKAGFNPNLKILGILLTMFDGRTNLSRQVTDEVRRFFGDLVFSTVIGRSVRLGEAPSYGSPIVYYDERSAGAMCYNLLCEEIEQRLECKVKKLDVVAPPPSAATDESGVVV